MHVKRAVRGGYQSSAAPPLDTGAVAGESTGALWGTDNAFVVGLRTRFEETRHLKSKQKLCLQSGETTIATRL